MSVATLENDVHERTSRRAGGRPRDSGRSRLWIWLFLTPTVVLYGLYTVYPIVASYWYSFVRWDGFGSDKSWIGLQNYRDVLADPLFWNSFKITVLFMLVTVPLQVVATLLIAIVLNSPKMPFSTLFRTALFLPVVTTTAIVGVVMQFVFDPASGPINLLLTRLGLLSEGINFLGDSSTALWTVAGVYVWKWFGITLVYWLAALQTIPNEVYEAARIDGAGPWKLMRHVTMPLLRPFLVIITLLSLEATLKVFDLMLTMTGGGPFYATEVVEIYIYRWAFAATVPQLGYASAAAVIFGLFVCLVGLFQLLGIRAVRRSGGTA
ncbi:carbohydrate ABC transporter permease [Actinopolymorpha rutila]|uniref:Multiple sugar transport system permease protein n=1 Tax=Actinopolymorpha rutila TaxID=446787 RepID=A0A852ZJG6_9ACTN|nr:sugar ABC transporter permease [Actinopolymorpha rutila]NYH92275.1 multiple sugar transport system permease protein [Actinopolymorpha rutila]